MPQDFSGQNLRGRAFSGLDLTGANFSYADIRGANFTNAILKGANFSYAKAGLKRRAVIGLLIISLTLAALSGLASGFTGYLITYFFQPKNLLRYPFPPALVVLGVLAIFFTIFIQQGIKAAFKALAITLIVASVVALPGALVGTIAVLGAVLGALAVAGSISVAGVGAGIITLAESLVMSGTLAIVGSKAMTRLIAESSNTILLGTELPALALALVLPSLSGYIGWQALSGDERFTFVRQIALSFAAIGSGTSFRSADLTDANFTQATLHSTDLRKATITRTRWFQAQKLDFARVGGTILIQPEVRNLVITGQGKREFFIRLNFQGANLAGADLTNANLTGSDMSGATLQGACLEQTNLTEIQALGTDFSRARFTGACLASWNIDSATRFDGVICDYVYLSSRQRERRPTRGKLAPEEFTTLFQ
ncbi:MAG TPA: pentapeptide repeat-containing protein [Coleofasciculaceae cyanobacterium]|jgi:uncharacterized protein YjbI with pentapeptide repeats